jgi:UDP-N-acetylglucosamine 2-epimerase (non-hydrolysing)
MPFFEVDIRTKQKASERKPLRVMVTFGTRPEAIKMAPLVMELSKHEDIFTPLVCVTAQHRNLLDGVLELFNIAPEYDLNIMKSGQTLEQVTTDVLMGMRDVLEEAKPDVVLVHGDTTTAFTAALAAFYQNIEVGHVEAGLRTATPNNPFPEEMNRRLVGRLATYHFAPTRRAFDALLAEGVSEEKIYLTGNTVVDAMQFIRHQTTVKFGFNFSPNRKLIVVTAHRRENFGQPLLNICDALRAIVRRNEDVEIVYPVHPNPNVISPVQHELGDEERIHLIEPMEYDLFIRLMSKSYLVLTDSGGIQEEAPTMGVPVLVMRDETERPETVQAGSARLIGTNTEKIIKETERLLFNQEAYEMMTRATQLYGDGTASRQIVNVLHRKASESEAYLETILPAFNPVVYEDLSLAVAS